MSKGVGCWSLKSELREWMVCVRLETGPVAGRWGAGMWRVEGVGELGVTVCVSVWLLGYRRQRAGYEILDFLEIWIFSCINYIYKLNFTH